MACSANNHCPPAGKSATSARQKNVKKNIKKKKVINILFQWFSKVSKIRSLEKNPEKKVKPIRFIKDTKMLS